MNLDAAFESQIHTIFAPLRAAAAASSMPRIASLTDALNKLCPQHIKATEYFSPTPTHRRLFASAAVESWMRGIHSFLVSVSLEQCSSVWASVAGYYASHYSVRALAHLAGTFLLFGRRIVVQLNADDSSFEFKPNVRDRREHSLYWRTVKALTQFVDNPFFDNNDHDTLSDQAHRNRANYADHVMHIRGWAACNHEELALRVRRISKLAVNTPPTVSRDDWPQVVHVQYRAYYRLVTFRRVVDEALGSLNNCWNVWRKPPWCEGLVNFQMVDPGAPLAASVN